MKLFGIGSIMNGKKCVWVSKYGVLLAGENKLIPLEVVEDYVQNQ